MGGTQRAHDCVDAPRRNKRLDADLGRALQPTGLPDRGVRPRLAEEGPGPGRAEAARRVLADAPCTGREERGAHRLDVLLGHERHELERGIATLRGAEGHALLHSQRVGQDVVRPALGHVEGRVGTEDGDPRAGGLEGDAPGGEPLLRREERRVVRDDRLGAGRACLVEHRARAVNRQEHARHLGRSVADQQPDVVPGRREAGRRDLLHRAHQVRNIHPHGATR